MKLRFIISNYLFTCLTFEITSQSNITFKPDSAIPSLVENETIAKIKGNAESKSDHNQSSVKPASPKGKLLGIEFVIEEMNGMGAIPPSALS